MHCHFFLIKSLRFLPFFFLINTELNNLAYWRFVFLWPSWSHTCSISHSRTLGGVPPSCNPPSAACALGGLTLLSWTFFWQFPSVGENHLIQDRLLPRVASDSVINWNVYMCQGGKHYDNLLFPTDLLNLDFFPLLRRIKQLLLIYLSFCFSYCSRVFYYRIGPIQVE